MSPSSLRPPITESSTRMSRSGVGMQSASNSRPLSQKRRPQHLDVPFYGVGAGLRVPHYQAVLEQSPQMGFFEVISENFMGAGGKPTKHLEVFSERFPMILHGVSLNIGGPDEPCRDYLRALKKLVKKVNPAWVSDHFCWCGSGDAHLHDLLPLAYTDELVDRVARRAKMVQDFLEVPLGLENTSSYLTYQRSTMTEWEFVSRVAEQADCGLMFDVNNVYVSAYNHGFDPMDFIKAIPLERILQVHVAGHTNYGDYIIDTHVGPLSEPVLQLYRELIRRAGPLSTLLEWDDKIPTFSQLQDEVMRIDTFLQQGLTAQCPILEELPIEYPLSDAAKIDAESAWLQAGAQSSPRDFQLSADEDQGDLL